MTLDQQIACVQREVKRCKRFLPPRIANQTMSEERVTHEIAAMQAALETLTSLRGLLTRGQPS